MSSENESSEPMTPEERTDAMHRVRLELELECRKALRNIHLGYSTHDDWGQLAFELVNILATPTKVALQESQKVVKHKRGPEVAALLMAAVAQSAAGSALNVLREHKRDALTVDNFANAHGRLVEAVGHLALGLEMVKADAYTACAFETLSKKS